MRRVALSDVMACGSMVVVEGCIIGLTIMASTAMAKGMSPFVFVVYTNALSSLILLPYSFFFDTNRVTISQNLAFVGLSYSSPIVACGFANQMPALSFILAILLRSTKFDWKRSGSLARLIGTLISFGGAISLTLYKGPTIKAPSLTLPLRPPLLVFISTHENWVLGCKLFAASSFALAIWNFLQAKTLKICKQVMKIISFYTLFGTIQTTGLALYFERDPEAWKLGLNFELLVIVLTGIFSSLIRTKVQMWCTRLKGPFFVALFKPCGIAYATTFGCLLFSTTFHYGSITGAFICGVGYYTVLWGQMKDEEASKLGGRNKIVSPSRDEKVPLLQQDSQV
ncbi:WAT1-related protein At1g70260-like isoform X2 [Salvia splendens]|uniref:WAT1-related protein At1g70260-like isoform X2 n=1 Tax=Salvia splendens TaxID=180675 RepID=UPI001C269C33|nr:WAT1-related protein At1g70260-like isoform X2 [Salvia splendens]